MKHSHRRPTLLLATLVAALALVASVHAAVGIPDARDWCIRTRGCIIPPSDLVKSNRDLEAKLLGDKKVCGDGVCNVAQGETCDSCMADCGKCQYAVPFTQCVQPGTVALTFDDGFAKYTESLIEILDKEQIKGTFFTIGEAIMANATNWPIMRKAMANGHEVASHTYTHRNMGKTGQVEPESPRGKMMTEAEMRTEILLGDLAAQHALGKRPRFFRPPQLDYRTETIRVIETLGMVPINVNVDTRDWEENAMHAKDGTLPSTQDIIDNFKKSYAEAKERNAKSFIVLQHDLYNFSIAAVPEIIKILRADKLEFVPMSKCLNETPYRDPTDNPFLNPRYGKLSAEMAAMSASILVSAAPAAHLASIAASAVASVAMVAAMALLL
ncbi:hypothetical protein H9P43_006095 [Blastocladiella emersonii ATCC 22665]|nr:hypothetical protein H9P43_006095 [Blastocladiella emersonii ATCC 22665]